MSTLSRPPLERLLDVSAQRYANVLLSVENHKQEPQWQRLAGDRLMLTNANHSRSRRAVASAVTFSQFSAATAGDDLATARAPWRWGKDQAELAARLAEKHKRDQEVIAQRGMRFT
jgi:hypothetical protein